MKRSLPFFLLPFLLLLAACGGGWQDEDKALFLETCKTGDIRHFISDDQARSFCDCRLQKFMEHYKTFNDVLEDKDSGAIEKEMQQCEAMAGL